MSAPLRETEVAVEPAFVALDGRAQPERVVHLVRVARGDVLADARDRPVVAGRDRSTVAIAGPTVGHRRGATATRSPAAVGTWRTRRAATVERVVRWARAYRERGSSPGAASYVTNPATHSPRARRPLRRRDQRRHHVSGRMASRTPAGRSAGTTGHRRQIVEAGLDHAPSPRPSRPLSPCGISPRRSAPGGPSARRRRYRGRRSGRSARPRPC